MMLLKLNTLQWASNPRQSIDSRISSQAAFRKDTKQRESLWMTVGYQEWWFCIFREWKDGVCTEWRTTRLYRVVYLYALWRKRKQHQLSLTWNSTATTACDSKQGSTVVRWKSRSRTTGEGAWDCMPPHVRKGKLVSGCWPSTKPM